MADAIAPMTIRVLYVAGFMGPFCAVSNPIRRIMGDYRQPGADNFTERTELAVNGDVLSSNVRPKPKLGDNFRRLRAGFRATEVQLVRAGREGWTMLT